MSRKQSKRDPVSTEHGVHPYLNQRISEGPKMQGLRTSYPNAWVAHCWACAWIDLRSPSDLNDYNACPIAYGVYQTCTIGKYIPLLG